MGEPKMKDMATRLHSSAIRLLRLLRREDEQSGLSGPRLSALWVLVFGGPMSLSELAEAEQVRPPTMSRIVDALVEQRLATRDPVPENRRSVRLGATDAGRRALHAGPDRRVRALTDRLGRLDSDERQALARAVDLLERVVA